MPPGGVGSPNSAITTHVTANAIFIGKEDPPHNYPFEGGTGTKSVGNLPTAASEILLNPAPKCAENTGKSSENTAAGPRKTERIQSYRCVTVSGEIPPFCPAATSVVTPTSPIKGMSTGT